MFSSRRRTDTGSGRSILPATSPHSPGRGSQGSPAMVVPADKAQLNGPFSLAIDGEDNVFIGDYENSRVRRVDPDGAITTVAGNGEVGTGGDGGHATEAQLNSPSRGWTSTARATSILPTRRTRSSGLSTRLASSGPYSWKVSGPLFGLRAVVAHGLDSASSARHPHQHGGRRSSRPRQ